MFFTDRVVYFFFFSFLLDFKYLAFVALISSFLAIVVIDITLINKLISVIYYMTQPIVFQLENR